MFLLKEMKIEHHYLNLAVDNDSPPRMLRLTIGGIVRKEFEVRLAVGEADFWAFIDIDEYRGELLKVECSYFQTCIANSIIQSDSIANREEQYHEKHRPQFHFTPKVGHMGALSALQHKEGMWQLFFEYNPFGNKGSNHITGCAASRDLIHWKESDKNYAFINTEDFNTSAQGAPQYLKLMVDGDPGETKWLCLSPNGIYSIGHFSEGNFIGEGPQETLWFGASSILCCNDAQGRCIQTGLADAVGNPDIPFGRQLLIPSELSLKTTEDGIRLFASPVKELQNLRIWTRYWNDIKLSSDTLIFSFHTDFRLAPDIWPDIRIVPAEGANTDISSELFEFITALDMTEAGEVELRLCGASIMLDKAGKTINCMGVTAPLPYNKNNIELHIFLDKSSLEIFANGRAAMSVVLPALEWTREVVLLCHKGRASISSFEIYGLRRIWPAAVEAALIAEASADDSLLYDSKSFKVYGGRVEDTVYGEPPAFAPDRDTIISPTRVLEEFQWRKNPWGDMTRVVDRGNVWHPNYGIRKFPDLFTGHNTFDAAYRVALDILYRCSGDEFARPGEKGLWSAGYFQGYGEGFGVWVRDTTHVAIRTGNLLDPEGARRSLLYTTMSGFDNAADGIGMPIVGIFDYYMATGDLTLAKDTWLNLKSRITRLEERFDDERGLIFAEQSTSNDAFPEPECGGFSLATEIYYMEAFRAMAKMGRRLGEEQYLTGKWNAMGKLLLNSIRTQYWKDTAGYFTSGPVGSESYSRDYWESSGQEMAIWPRYGIADSRQRAKILEKLPETAMNEFGVNVFPYRKETNHFCNAAWVAWTAGIAAAAGREGDLDLLMKLIAQQVRNCVMNKTFYEVIDYNTGRAWRWPGQLWHAAGFLSYFYLGVLGMEYDEEGLYFTPAVPEPLSGLKLVNFRYRRAVFDISVKNWGTDFILKLDGIVTSHIPAHLEGRHTIELFMASK